MFASPHFRSSVLPRHFLTAASFILFNSLRRTSFVAPSIPASIAQGCGIQGRAAWKSILLASKLLFHPSSGCRQLRGVCDDPEVVFSVERYILRLHVFRAVLKLVTKSNPAKPYLHHFVGTTAPESAASGWPVTRTDRHLEPKTPQTCCVPVWAVVP